MSLPPCYVASDEAYVDSISIILIFVILIHLYI